MKGSRRKARDGRPKDVARGARAGTRTARSGAALLAASIFLFGMVLAPNSRATRAERTLVARATARAPTTLLAMRPGGGSSFSGSSRSSSGSSSRSSSSSSSRSSSGSSSRSSGGSSSSGDWIGGLFGLIFSTTLSAFGFVGFVIFLIVLAQIKKRLAGTLDWQAGVALSHRDHEPLRRRLEALQKSDPNFSLVLFEDFLYALYAQTHTLRGARALDRLSPYLKAPARATLTALGDLREVRSIVIGAMRYRTIDGMSNDGPTVWAGIEFETNYTEIQSTGSEQSFYVCEQWMLSRAKTTLSRTPDRVRVFACPQCGAPLDTVTGGKCQYCQGTVDTGQFDWVVETIEVTSREARGPMLTGTTEERGTNEPTVFDPDVGTRFAALSQRDPALAWPAFQARLGVIFAAMQVSWSNRDGAAIRPYVSDNLFQMLAYWIETYRKARLRNVTEGARIEQVELVRVASDRFFDALTVRVFASSTDFTIADDDGRVVGGNRNATRRYSEYWTLIRSSSRAGQPRESASCPACGAPLQIEMAGHCVYCRAKVTSGEFDWVLSRIEQDEVYEG